MFTKKNTDQKLDYGIWWVSHQPLLRKIGRIALLILAGVPWAFFIGYLIVYFTHIQSTAALLEQFSATRIINDQITTPKNLQVVATYAFSDTPGSVDLLAQVTNLNADFLVPSFTYTFSYGGQTTTPQLDYLINGQSKYLVSANFPANLIGSEPPKLTISAINWQRLSSFGDLPLAQFATADVNYALVAAGEGELAVQSQVSGAVTNQSPYGFKQVQTAVVLTFNSVPIAAKSALYNNILSNQQFTINYNWAKKYPLRSQVVTQIDANVMDQANLILP